MATVNAYRPLDMVETSIWYGVVTSYNSNTIVISAGSYVATYTGSFSYDIWGNVYGQLSSYRLTINGSLAGSATGINRDAFTYNSYLNRGDAQGALDYVLSGADTLNGSAGADRLLGLAGSDVINGGGGADTLGGGLGHDILRGGDGNDLIYGFNGNDRLYGGAGTDTLAGGSGADTFVFLTAQEMRSASGRDKIEVFQSGVDRIDLSSIDARPGTSGDQAFSFIGGAQFSGIAGQLRYANGVVYLDLNGDRHHDYAFEIQNAAALSASSFIL